MRILLLIMIGLCSAAIFLLIVDFKDDIYTQSLSISGWITLLMFVMKDYVLEKRTKEY